MIKNLVKIAQELDDMGLRKEADIVDLIIKKVSQELGQDPDDDQDSSISEKEFNKMVSGTSFED